MEIEVFYRTPSVNHVTIKVDGTNNVLEKEEYNKIITPASKVEGTGRDYLNARNRLLEAYFTDGPKEQFSW
jgi:hypothetical protein